ncbi:hypothetical protein [Methylomonas sp. ZR1]|uniref:hypothetical protein n=1 Tax=Methylomonas sp. ZR1 TaxID=1797072 RepID=UPI00149109A8|nr:hypothetical protein [Methylomonas sp. ZR1]
MALVILFILIIGIKLAVKSAKAEIKEKRKERAKTFVNPISEDKPTSIKVDRLESKEMEETEYQLSIDWESKFLQIEQAVKHGDYEFARIWLQKFAYTSVDKDVPQFVRDRFKSLMSAFAKEDPLYRRLISEIKPIIESQPGVLQTSLYPLLPEFNEEQIRYVLYFAHELGDLNRLKKGRSYQLFGPTSRKVIQPGEKIGATIATSNIVITKNPIDERIAALHREATQHKVFDWDAAVACLQEANDLMRRHGGIYDIERWLRLPVFLQQAGRFQEAMQVFNQLLNDVEPRVRAEFSHTSPTTINKHIHLHYQKIYDKMRMACKREKRLEEATQFGAMSLKHGEQAQALQPIIDSERDAERKAYEEKRARKLN